MKTVITTRKTPHATENTVNGVKGPHLVLKERFVDGDPNGKTEMAFIPQSQCYPSSGRQDLPDYQFTASDLRNSDCDVWNARSKNRRKGLGWNTDAEIEEKCNSGNLLEFLPNNSAVPPGFAINPKNGKIFYVRTLPKNEKSESTESPTTLEEFIS